MEIQEKILSKKMRDRAKAFNSHPGRFNGCFIAAELLYWANELTASDQTGCAFYARELTDNPEAGPRRNK